MHSDFAKLCEPVARIAWGKPSSETARELRWGTHGSRVVDRAKGVWHDHERGVGGGTLDLVPGATKKDRLQWLRDRGLIGKTPNGARKNPSHRHKENETVATHARQVRARRSLPARHPPHGAWPAEMRADMVAAYLDYETTGGLYAAVLRGEAPRPTGERLRNGRREPTWALDALKVHVAKRHEIACDALPGKENIGELV